MSSTRYRLYAGSYATAEEPGIHVFSFDANTGALEPLGAFAGVPQPSFVVPHPTKPVLYAASELGRPHQGVFGAAWALGITEKPLSLSPVGNQSTDGDWPCHLEIDRASCWLLASNYGAGVVAVLPIREDGSLGPCAAIARHAPEDVSHAHSTAFSPDGRFAVVADLGLDVLVTYRFDAQVGSLAECARVKTPKGAGPRHMAFHPDGRTLYAANELDSTVGVYDYDAERGILTERQMLSTLPEDAAGQKSYVADIHVSPSGDRVYVSNRGHDSIAVFAAAPDGALTQLAVRPCGGKWPRNFAISPEGRFLLVAGQHSGDISVLPILDDERALGNPIARVTVPNASCVRFG